MVLVRHMLAAIITGDKKIYPLNFRLLRTRAFAALSSCSNVDIEHGSGAPSSVAVPGGHHWSVCWTRAAAAQPLTFLRALAAAMDPLDHGVGAGASTSGGGSSSTWTPDDLSQGRGLMPSANGSRVGADGNGASASITAALAAVQKKLAEAPATESRWLGGEPVSWSTFLLPADAETRRLFPLANLSSETNIVDPLSGRSCLAWQPPVTCAGTVEPELLRACELHPLSTKGDGNCLLHAAALGAWGVHDQAGTKNVGVLRSMVFNLLNNEQFVRVLLPRMRAEQVSVMTMRPRSRPPPS